MASLLKSAGTSLISSLLNSGNTNQVQANIDPTLLRFLQNQGKLAANFQESQSGVAGSTMTAGRQSFNRYAALLNANQTANQVAAAQQNINNALNAGNQLTTNNAGTAGTGAGLNQGINSG